MAYLINANEVSSHTEATVQQHLRNFGSVHVIYPERCFLEIALVDGFVKGRGNFNGYRVVYKHYEPLGCCDDWFSIGPEYFELADENSAVKSFLVRIANGPEEA